MSKLFPVGTPVCINIQANGHNTDLRRRLHGRTGKIAGSPVMLDTVHYDVLLERRRNPGRHSLAERIRADYLRELE